MRNQMSSGLFWLLRQVLQTQAQRKLRWIRKEIARFCAIFSVSEIVVFHEQVQDPKLQQRTRGKHRKVDPEDENIDVTLARMLEYLETPQSVCLNR